VLARARRRGLATAAVRLLTRWAIAGAGMRRIEALVEPVNRASLRVLERCSFRREGLLRYYSTSPTAAAAATRTCTR
jgi:RimJ/RimL family protein N-acetyltransferase